MGLGGTRRIAGDRIRLGGSFSSRSLLSRFRPKFFPMGWVRTTFAGFVSFIPSRIAFSATGNFVPDGRAIPAFIGFTPLADAVRHSRRGIFTQIAAHGNDASASVLSVDAIAIDFSTFNTASVTPAVVPAAVAGGQPASLVTQTAAGTLGPGGVLKTAFRLSSNPTPRLKLLDTAKRASLERPELPEVIALAAGGIPTNGPVSEMVQSGIPSPSIDSITEPTTEPQGLVATDSLASVVIGINPNDIDTGEIDLAEQRAPANLVVYSAGWLTVAVSAPGLTSMIRRGRRRVRRYSTVVPKDRVPGLAR